MYYLLLFDLIAIIITYNLKIIICGVTVSKKNVLCGVTVPKKNCVADLLGYFIR